jgi:chromosome segregation ATPase
MARQAETLQSSLTALAERIDDLNRGQDKLERENRALRDHIGDLTRTMSKSRLSSIPGSCNGQI